MRAFDLVYIVDHNIPVRHWSIARPFIFTSAFAITIPVTYRLYLLPQLTRIWYATVFEFAELFMFVLLSSLGSSWLLANTHAHSYLSSVVIAKINVQAPTWCWSTCNVVGYNACPKNCDHPQPLTIINIAVSFSCRWDRDVYRRSMTTTANQTQTLYTISISNCLNSPTL